jgi:solute carrier family 25 citrate transporter 1
LHSKILTKNILEGGMTLTREKSQQEEQTQLSLALPATKKPITITQSFIVGAIAGKTEVLCNHWMWTTKTRSQSGLPFTFHPSVLLKGIGGNLASMGPISAIQVGTNRAIQGTFFEEGKELSLFQKMGAAFTAGATSALVSCPTERIMTHQGKKRLSFLAAAKYLVEQGGVSHGLYAGFPVTTVREGVFALCYLVLAPTFKPYWQTYLPNENASKLAAGISAGVIGTLCSQTADIVKTQQQYPDPLEQVTARDALRKLYQSYGVGGFLKGGLLSRGARICVAVPVMDGMNQWLESKFRKF